MDQRFDIPPQLLDADSADRYANTLIRFAEAGVRSRHISINAYTLGEISAILHANRASERHSVINAIMAALDAYGQTRPDIITVDDMMRWVTTRIEVVDYHRERWTGAQLRNTALAQRNDNFLMLGPIFTAKVPFLQTQLVDYLHLVERIAAEPERPRTLITQPTCTPFMGERELARV